MERYLADGTRIVTRVKNPLFLNRTLTPLDTAMHEAYHATAARRLGVGVIEVSRIPGPGFGGYTRMTSFDAVAAAAPFAFGCRGTGPGVGSDQDAIRRAGYDVGVVASAARSLLAGRTARYEVAAIASRVEQQGSIGASEVEEARSEVRSFLELGPEVVLSIFSPDGGYEQKTVRTKAPDLAPADLPREYIA